MTFPEVKKAAAATSPGRLPPARRAWAGREGEPLGTSRLVGSARATFLLDRALTAHAAVRSPVWLVGETGVGKSHAARLLHERSDRARGPLVAVRSEEQLLALGRLLQVPPGTICVEGLDTFPERALPHLRWALQEVERRGWRLVATSTADRATRGDHGEEMVDPFLAGRGSSLRVPPLRERAADVRPLIAHFLAVHQQPCRRLTAAAWDALLRYPWPGNIRELKNAVLTAARSAPAGQPIDVAELPHELLAPRLAGVPRPGEPPRVPRAVDAGLLAPR